MSKITILVLVLGYADAGLEGRCRCYKELRLIDCTSVGLHSMPHVTSALDNYSSILLNHNYLKHVNFTSLFQVLPRIVLLDLRDNNSLLCQDITRLQPSKLINIICDCMFSTAKIPTYSTSVIPATHEKKTLTYHSSSRMESSNQVIWYTYPLIATLNLIILPTTVILFRSIIGNQDSHSDRHR